MHAKHSCFIAQLIWQAKRMWNTSKISFFLPTKTIWTWVPDSQDGLSSLQTSLVDFDDQLEFLLSNTETNVEINDFMHEEFCRFLEACMSNRFPCYQNYRWPREWLCPLESLF